MALFNKKVLIDYLNHHLIWTEKLKNDFRKNGFMKSYWEGEENIIRFCLEKFNNYTNLDDITIELKLTYKNLKKQQKDILNKNSMLFLQGGINFIKEFLKKLKIEKDICNCKEILSYIDKEKTL